jgi:hypothetical protein
MKFIQTSSPSIPDQPVPNIQVFRQAYEATSDQLKIIIPAGTVDLQWIPIDSSSHYWINDCYHPGHISAIEEPLYHMGALLPFGKYVILLPPGSSGLLAFRSIGEIEVETFC